ncbi:hypothetical protein ACFL10_01685 [Patescibacteria group bacterium]
MKKFLRKLSPVAILLVVLAATVVMATYFMSGGLVRMLMVVPVGALMMMAAFVLPRFVQWPWTPMWAARWVLGPLCVFLSFAAAAIWLLSSGRISHLAHLSNHLVSMVASVYLATAIITGMPFCVFYVESAKYRNAARCGLMSLTRPRTSNSQ